MITDALTSCGFLLLGSGSSIYKLIKHSINNSSVISPKILIASFGIGVLGARSVIKIVYNFFLREYPIDPLEIEVELKNDNNINIIDWSLSKIGIGSIIYSLYQHYNCPVVGLILLSTLTSIEVINLVDEFIKNPVDDDDVDDDDDASLTIVKKFKNSIGGQLDYLWIISNDLFSQSVGNTYFRLANFAYFIATIYQPDNQSWSMKNSINDYMMLLFVILSTESIIQTE